MEADVEIPKEFTKNYNSLLERVTDVIKRTIIKHGYVPSQGSEYGDLKVERVVAIDTKNKKPTAFLSDYGYHVPCIFYIMNNRSNWEAAEADFENGKLVCSFWGERYFEESKAIAQEISYILGMHVKMVCNNDLWYYGGKPEKGEVKTYYPHLD